MDDFKTYTHLLNYTLWFNEASIQVLLNQKFNGNLDESVLLQKTTVASLTEIQEELSDVNLTYLFNKPDVTLPNVEPIPQQDIVVAATWPGTLKELIHVTDGGEGVFDSFQRKAWNIEHKTGLYSNTFAYGGDVYVGLSVQVKDLVIVICVKTSEDNSAPPEKDETPPPVERGGCEIEGVPLCTEIEPPADLPCSEFQSIY